MLLVTRRDAEIKLGMNTRHRSGGLTMLGAAIGTASIVIASTPLTLQGRQQLSGFQLAQPSKPLDRIERRTLPTPAKQTPSQSATTAVGPAAAPDPAQAVVANDVAVDFLNIKQTMDGFGASDAWNPTLSEADADLFFSVQNGIGLSLLRLNVLPNGTDSAAISNAQLAVARGARVWASPWSAPAAWKDNGLETNGGHLCAAAGQGLCTGSHYLDWANRLVSFVSLMKSSGVDLYALSAQNEPDLGTNYQSMVFTDAEMVNFVKTLGPRLATLTPRPKLLAGEHTNWSLLWPMANAIEADAAANSLTDLYGTHQYTGVSPFVAGRTKPIWQTEMSSFDPFDPSINNAIQVARWVNEAVTAGNVNAWSYWWLRGANADNEGLTGNSTNATAGTKRLFALGNFSRFVRPGWVRVNTTTNPTGVEIVAFKKAATGEFAIVVTNTGTARSLTVGTSGGNGPLLGQITPYETYDDGVVDYTLGAHGNLQAGTPFSPAVDQFTATARHGVTTFVGVVADPPPGAFAKAAPAAGSTGQPLIPALSWTASAGAWSYDYCLDTTNDNACSTSWTNVATATSAVLPRLNPGTTYYWQVRANTNGGSTYANGSSTLFVNFTTLAALPPVVITGAGTISGTGVKLAGTANPQGFNAAAWFEYGTTTSYGATIAATPSLSFEVAPVSVTASLKGLTCGTIYHFRMVGTSAGGTNYGADQAFVACLGTTNRTRGDIDGDRRSDISIYRPSTGEWWVLNSKQDFTAYTRYGWGLTGDVPVPSDYDGDGQTDVAIYRPTTGGWWILKSGTNFNTYDVRAWGLPGDVPVPGDYDGDGKADPAIYRPTTGEWWVLKSSTNFATYTFRGWGLPGDVPVPADYDGDGKTDVAIYRPSTGEWWILWSSSNSSTYTKYGWGLSGDTPVAGDYDGDGKSDIAIFRQTTGEWWVLKSSTNFGTYSVSAWGLNGDVPVPADYDGDGKTDVAVYRPSTGYWWLVPSSTGTSGYVGYGWGLTADVPLTKKP